MAIPLPYLELVAGELPDGLFLASALAALGLVAWCVVDSLER